MADRFDPYQTWLGLNLGGREPNHYELLALELFEADKGRINEAADRAANLVVSRATPAQIPQSQKVLYQISTARVCLLNSAEKARYDQQLQQSSLPPQAVESQPPAVAEMRVIKAPPPAHTVPTNTVPAKTVPTNTLPAQTKPTYSMPTQGPAAHMVQPTATPLPATPQNPSMSAGQLAAQLAGHTPVAVPTARLAGGTEAVVARVKHDQSDSLGNIPSQARRVRKRSKMSIESILVITIMCVLAAGIGIYAIISIMNNPAKPTESSQRGDSTAGPPKQGHAKQEQLLARPKPVPDSRPTRPRDLWVDAATTPIELGSAHVSLVHAFVGPLPGLPGTTDYLYLHVRVRNIDPSEPLEVASWESWADRSVRSRAIANDALGHPIRSVNPFDKKLTWNRLRLAPDEHIDQFLLFERPSANLLSLRLALAGSAVGVRDTLRFEIPASMITEADSKLLAAFRKSLPDEAFSPNPTDASPIDGNPNDRDALNSNDSAHVPNDPAVDPVEAAVGVRAKSE